MRLQSSKAFGGFLHCRRGPAQRHRGRSPSLHVSADATHGAHDILHDVGAGKRPTKFFRQAEPCDSEDFVEALQNARRHARRIVFQALTNWVLAGAKVQPVVLAFEDLHWADPTTIDVLRGIAERGALAPLFFVATARPEFRAPWGMRSHHGTISLAPLDRAQVRDMVAELSARHALPREVVEDVAARTGGVPLFVEEVTRLLLERGEQGDIQAIPPTLQQSLMARLDRLGPSREVAQVASVIGRGFSYGLLRAVAGMADAPLQAALEKLADADIGWSRACRQRAIIVSSTRSSRTRLTKICSRAGARRCTGGWRKFYATALAQRRRPNRKRWRTTSRKPA
jgi:hypothetical protein